MNPVYKAFDAVQLQKPYIVSCHLKLNNSNVTDVKWDFVPCMEAILARCVSWCH